jgi:multiple antibiotic resistance protein
LVDSIGTVPVYITVTSVSEDSIRRRIAVKATFDSATLWIFFVVAGEAILLAIDIPLAAFQVAGGIILFLFVLSMNFGESRPNTFGSTFGSSFRQLL